MFLSCSKQQTLCERWNCLLNQTYSVERMPTCVPSECSFSRPTTSYIYSFKWICLSQIFTLRENLSWVSFVSLRCKKKVPATKRFTVHRTSNVLTLSLKRFANFSGGKITKVNRGISHRLPFCKCCLVSLRAHVSVVCISQDVGYPEFLNIRPYMSQSSGDPVMYGLYAVLVHSGYSCHAGHYYCYVKVRWVTEHSFFCLFFFFEFIWKSQDKLLEMSHLVVSEDLL